jgi:hypothetical protein
MTGRKVTRPWHDHLSKRTYWTMKGISIIHDETKKKRYLQIDMELIGSKRGAIYDFLDLLLIAARKDEPTVPFEVIEKRIERLNNSGIRR